MFIQNTTSYTWTLHPNNKKTPPLLIVVKGVEEKRKEGKGSPEIPGARRRGQVTQEGRRGRERGESKSIYVYVSYT